MIEPVGLLDVRLPPRPARSPGDEACLRVDHDHRTGPVAAHHVGDVLVFLLAASAIRDVIDQHMRLDRVVRDARVGTEQHAQVALQQGSEGGGPEHLVVATVPVDRTQEIALLHLPDDGRAREQAEVGGLRRRLAAEGASQRRRSFRCSCHGPPHDAGLGPERLPEIERDGTGQGELHQAGERPVDPARREGFRRAMEAGDGGTHAMPDQRLVDAFQVGRRLGAGPAPSACGCGSRAGPAGTGCVP